MTDRYIIIVKESNVPALNAWLDKHPDLDPRGGGGNTFYRGLVWASDPTDGSVIRGRVCEWKMPTEWWQILDGEFNLRGLKINETRLSQWDGSYYPKGEGWTFQSVLADETRKPNPMAVLDTPEEVA